MYTQLQQKNKGQKKDLKISNMKTGYLLQRLYLARPPKKLYHLFSYAIEIEK
jgi:hypothetical protein